MHIKINKEHIVESLQKSAAIIPAKSGTAFLRSVWLQAEGNTLSIMSTDANVEFTGTYEVEIIKSGLVGVNGQVFVDLIRRLPSGILDIMLDAESTNLHIKQDRRIYKLPISPSDWFQSFSKFPTENAIIWSGDFLGDILEKITYCINDGNNMDAMSCLYMKPIENGNIEVCGLNGHQFAMEKFNNEDLSRYLPSEGILIQKQYINDIKKWLVDDEIEINFSDKRMFIRTLDSREMISFPKTVLEYPDYSTFLSKIYEKEVNTLIFDKEEAIDALNRIIIFNTGNERCTYFKLSEKEAILTAQGQEIGSASESIDVEYKGAIENIAFPTQNLIDVLNHFSSKKLN